MSYRLGTQPRMWVFFLIVIRIQVIQNCFRADPHFTLTVFGRLPGVHSIKLVIDEFLSVSVDSLPSLSSQPDLKGMWATVQNPLQLKHFLICFRFLVQPWPGYFSSVPWVPMHKMRERHQLICAIARLTWYVPTISMDEKVASHWFCWPPCQLQEPRGMCLNP